MIIVNKCMYERVGKKEEAFLLKKRDFKGYECLFEVKWQRNRGLGDEQQWLLFAVYAAAAKESGAVKWDLTLYAVHLYYIIKNCYYISIL